MHNIFIWHPLIKDIGLAHTLGDESSLQKERIYAYVISSREDRG
jgi:hypothetical protein